MQDAMTLERFAELAEAYGGDVTRWPLACRDAAAELMILQPQATAQMLEAAGELDWALHQWRAPSPGPALQAAVLTAAPRPKVEQAWRTWIWRTGLGAGLMAAGAAGLMAGVVVSAAVAPTSDLEIVAAAAPPYEDLASELGGEV